MSFVAGFYFIFYKINCSIPQASVLQLLFVLSLQSVTVTPFVGNKKYTITKNNDYNREIINETMIKINQG